MQNRRTFLQKGAALAATLSLSGPANSQVAAKPEVGIITNTLRSEFEQDYQSALKALADMGYTHIEGSVPASCPSAQAFKSALEANGLASVSLGSGMSKLRKEMDEYLRIAEVLESPYVVCYYPWLTSAENLQMEEVMQTAERLNEVGKKIKEAGFRFAWHNHDKEFVDIEGRTAFDILMQNTDPELVAVQLDWYWVAKGEADPVELFNKYPGRFELAHVKDMNNNRDRGITCVGQGILDFDEIFAHAQTGGVKHFIVENERAIQGLACARVSYDTVSRILA
jgi:sugar phosphate isomerase/epimerase